MNTAWYHSDMETLSALLALCEGTGEFPSQRASNEQIWCWFYVSPNKVLKKWLSGWKVETPWRSRDLYLYFERYREKHPTFGGWHFKCIRLDQSNVIWNYISLASNWQLPAFVQLIMMTWSNGNIFRVTGHSCGEFTGPRWIPRTKASNAEL